MFRLRPRWVLPLTFLSVLPLLVLGFFVVQRLSSLSEERYRQEVVAARYASEVAADGIQDRLRDHFRPWRQTLIYAHVQGQEIFESKLRKMYLTSALVASPQFVEEGELRELEITEDMLLPAGLDAATVGHRCELVSIAALRRDLFEQGRRRMGFDPSRKRFRKKLIVSDEDLMDVAPIHWVEVDLDGPLAQGCGGCEKELLELGEPLGSRKIALLAVTFPLPGGSGMLPGMFGALIPTESLLEEIVAPEVLKFYEDQDAMPLHGLRLVDAHGEVVLPEPDAEDTEATMALSHAAALHSESLFGPGSPWQLQVVALSGFDAESMRAENNRWALAMLAAALVLIFGAVLFSRSYLHHLEMARLRTHLLSNVSHELKTPLSLIRLYTETLESGRTRSEEERAKFLAIIGRESKRLSHLIDNLLDVQRIEEDRKQYSFAQIRPDRVVRQTVEAYRYQLIEEGFDLRLDIDDDLPLVHIDEEALAQALINLLDNAAKYSDTRKEIRVHCGQRGDRVCISVEDRGIGIPPREQKKIFENFYRVEQSMVHDVKGSGLGLAVVAHVARAHGGTVEVESVPGRGSTFTICLPLEFQPEHG